MVKQKEVNLGKKYGPVEHIEELIQNIEQSGEDYMLIGDLNAKIGNKENGISGNKEETNTAG